MIDNGRIVFAKAGEDFEREVFINSAMANRHGFICGATGTGKTVTLKVLAEHFSKAGVPVLMSDVKGDLSGMVRPGEDSSDVRERASRLGVSDSFQLRAFPTAFFDIYGKRGIPLRTTISEFGPLLLSRILELSATQTELLNVVFKIADDMGLLLIDTKDIKAMLSYVYENKDEFEAEYGHIARASITTIIRAVVALESEDSDKFIGEPAIDIADFFATDKNGIGYINILDASTLINNPRLYAAFMLYLLSELFERLPEAGDLEKPKMVMFFDEAHLLFDNASKTLLDKIAQVIKLIRSKGVGVYFVTQSPADIPGEVLAQLSNKIEHALRAYTPAEQKAVRAAAKSFRENPAFDTEDLIQNLGTGEAIVSVLDENGIPTVSEHAFILPPESYMGAITEALRKDCFLSDRLSDKYLETVDRDSCYEFMQRRNKKLEEDKIEADKEAARKKEEALQEKERLKAEEKELKEKQKAEALAEKERLKAQERELKEMQKAKEQAEKARLKEEENRRKRTARAAKSVLSTTAGTIGREIGNNMGDNFGSFGKKIGGNLGASLGRNILGTLFKI